MRTPIVAGNWKMNLTGAEGAALLEGFKATAEMHDETDVYVFPSYLGVAKVHDLLRGSRIKLGVQDAFWMDKGAFTGRVSVAQLREFHVEVCLVGHSETRGRFGALEIPESTTSFFAETDETCNLKIKALLAHGIIPLLCVGETLAEREAGNTDAVIASQLAGALAGIEPTELSPLVVAYEPVWAIGTGQTCDTPEANRVCGVIRAKLAEIANPAFANNTRILYGGSVKASNAQELFTQPDIDGGLVGGASLKAEEFQRIILAAKPN